MANNVLLNVGVQGQQQVNTLNQSIQQAGQNTTRTVDQFQAMRQELRQMRAVMLSAADGSREYSNALARASEIQRRMREQSDILRLSIKDVGETSKNIAGAMAGVASGFQVAQGTMALFGVENEAVMQTMVKLQAVMSITQGLVQFANGIEDIKDLITGLGATAAQTTQQAGNLQQGLNNTTTAANNTANSLGGVNNGLGNMATNMAGTTTLTNQLANGTGNLNNMMRGLSGSTQNLNRYRDNLARSLQLESDILRIQQADYLNVSSASNTLLQSQGLGVASAQNQTQALTSLNAALGSTNQQNQNLINSGAVVQRQTASFASTLLTSLGSMALYMVAIAGIIWLFSKLIEKMNEIPKDLELKIKLNEDVFKETKKIKEQLLEISHEQNLLNQARVRNDKKTTSIIQANIENILNSIRDGAGEEYKVAKNKDKWLAEFAATENERQRKLAYNKVLFSKQADAMVSMNAEKATLLEIEKRLSPKIIKDLQNAYRLQKPDDVEGWIFSQVNKLFSQEEALYIKTLANITKLKEESKILLSLKEEDVFQVTKSGAGAGSKTTNKEDKKTRTADDVSGRLEKKSGVDVKQRKSDADIIIQLNKDLNYDLVTEEQKAFQLNEDLYADGVTSFERYLQIKLDLLKRFGAEQSDIDKAQMELTIAKVGEYAKAIENVSNFISDILQDEMEIQDNKFYKERNNLELSQSYRQADSEQQQQMMYELELANYEKNKKIFESNKAFQIAATVAQGISNEATLLATYFADSAKLYPGARIAAAINLGIGTAANIITTAQTVRKIASTSMDAPVPPSGGSGGGSGLNVALNPAKDALTSKEENLNMMNKSNLEKQNAPTVRVSDINKVQNTVKVREQNSVY